MNLRIPKNLFLLTVVFIILLLVFTLVMLSALLRPSQQEDASVSPTTSPPVIRQGNSPLVPKEISPREDTSGQTISNPSQKITVTLSQSVEPTDIRAVATPSLPLKVTAGDTPNRIRVFPDPPEFWRPEVNYRVQLYDQQDRLITEYFIKVPPLQIDEIIEEHN